MKIGFDAKRAFFNRSGLGNYSRNLLRSFFRYFPQNEYLLYSPSSNNIIGFSNRENYSIRTPEKQMHKMFQSYWRTKGIREQLLKDDVDVYHGLSSELPVLRKGDNIRTVVTVHDLIYMRYPELYTFIDRKIYFRKTKYACDRANRIVAISDQTRKDIIRFTGTPAEKISVIYQDCHPLFYAEYPNTLKQKTRDKYKLPDTYLLYVGTVEERKNLLSIIKAIEIGKIDMPLVVVGRKRDYYKKVKDYIERNRIKNILFLDEVTNEDLPLIYSLASCFIYPSVFEGFGIPVIEALVSGVPVITSRGSCFSEAGGPGSIYIDPHNPEELSRAILDVINDSLKADKMVSEGLKYAERFRSDKIASQYMEVYSSIS